MRRQEFEQWLINSSKTPGITKFYLGAIRNIEKDHKINLDDEFKKDTLKSLIELFKYSADDERNNRPNPTNLKTKTKSLYKTLSTHRSALNQYREFCLMDGDDTTDEAQNKNTIIKLEAHLQAALRANMKQFDPTLKIIDEGIERVVDSGKIDILAQDKNGDYVVIELKAGTAKGDVIGQILGYMADIVIDEKQKKENVRGIIVAGDFHKRVTSAASLTPSLSLISYTHRFDFKKETPEPIK